MSDRELKFKALFKHKVSDKTTWFHAEINKEIDTRWFVQVSPWLQYTDWTDTTSQQICEGDIVSGRKTHTGNTKNCIVMWSSKMSGFGFYQTWVFKGKRYYELYAKNLAEPKVIGNIYENPELLERETRKTI